jgi:putative FmdB family regulatory protein
VPTYEYRCKSCGETLEVVQSFSDDALTTHEACGGDLRKVFGSVGIAFKGSGFYKNDSRGKSSSVTPPGSSEGGGSGDKGSSSDSSSSGDSSSSSDSSSTSSSSTSSSSTSSADTKPAKAPSTTKSA